MTMSNEPNERRSKYLWDLTSRNGFLMILTVLALACSVAIVVDALTSHHLWVVFGNLAVVSGVMAISAIRFVYTLPSRIFPVILFALVTVAIATTWVPGVLYEGELFAELEGRSIPSERLSIALSNACESAQGASVTNSQWEKVDALLKFPVMTEINSDRVIEYGYTMFSKQVASSRWPRASIILVLSVLCGLVFVRIAFAKWPPRLGYLRMGLMVAVFFVLGGLLPLPLSGHKSGNVAYAGFYAALFTWLYGLRFENMKDKFGIKGKRARSTAQAQAIYSYYMRVLGFALGIFGVVVIGLVFQVSRMMGDMFALSRTLQHHLLATVIWHDFYGSLVLFVGIVLQLIKMLAKVVRLFPSESQTSMEEGDDEEEPDEDSDLF